jgi:hypothetical protein
MFRTGFPQVLRTLFAAHFHDLGADLHLNGIRIELAIAGGTGFLSHDTSFVNNPSIGHA